MGQEVQQVAKIVTAGHTTKIDGIDELTSELRQWPEIRVIRLGKISGGTGRSGGGFTFHATRDAHWGGRITGIKCIAGNGRAKQEVELYPRRGMHDQLKARLAANKMAPRDSGW